MPKYYCDYCDTYLTHDSPSVRKTHCTGRKHKDNVKFYYQKWMEEQAQHLIDATTAAFKAGKIAQNPFAKGAAVPPPAALAGPPRPGAPPGPPGSTQQGAAASTISGPPPGVMPPPPPLGGMPQHPPFIMGPHGAMSMQSMMRPMMGPKGTMMGPMGPMMGPMGPMGPPMRPPIMNGPSIKTTQ